MDGDDVIVLDGGRRLGFAQEPLPRRVARGQGGLHRLQCDEPFQLRVFRQEDDAHAAGAEDFQDAIRTEPADLIRTLRLCEEMLLSPAIFAGKGEFARCRAGDTSAAVTSCDGIGGGSGGKGGSAPMVAAETAAGVRMAITCPQWGHFTCLPTNSSLTRRLLRQPGRARPKAHGNSPEAREGEGVPASAARTSLLYLRKRGEFQRPVSIYRFGALLHPRNDESGRVSVPRWAKTQSGAAILNPSHCALQQ